MNNLRLLHRLGLSALLGLISTAAHAQSQNPTGIAHSQTNQAFITQLGESHKATIEQSNIHGGLLYGTIQQDGLRNEASISLEGGDLSGSITQDGNDNHATLEIRGEQNRGAIEQHGDGNSNGLQIDGYGMDVAVIQGNGQAYNGPVRVRGDAPGGQPITIWQR